MHLLWWEVCWTRWFHSGTDTNPPSTNVCNKYMSCSLVCSLVCLKSLLTVHSWVNSWTTVILTKTIGQDFFCCTSVQLKQYLFILFTHNSSLLGNTIDYIETCSTHCEERLQVCVYTCFYSSSLLLPSAFLSVLYLSPSPLRVSAGCQVLRMWGMQDCNAVIKFTLFPKWPEKESSSSGSKSASHTYTNRHTYVAFSYTSASCYSPARVSTDMLYKQTN